MNKAETFIIQYFKDNQDKFHDMWKDAEKTAHEINRLTGENTVADYIFIGMAFTYFELLFNGYNKKVGECVLHIDTVNWDTIIKEVRDIMLKGVKN
jgi:hypothetical protein